MHRSSQEKKETTAPSDAVSRKQGQDLQASGFDPIEESDSDSFSSDSPADQPSTSEVRASSLLSAVEASVHFQRVLDASLEAQNKRCEAQGSRPVVVKKKEQMTSCQIRRKIKRFIETHLFIIRISCFYEPQPDTRFCEMSAYQEFIHNLRKISHRGDLARIFKLLKASWRDAREYGIYRHERFWGLCSRVVFKKAADLLSTTVVTKKTVALPEDSTHQPSHTTLARQDDSVAVAKMSISSLVKHSLLSGDKEKDEERGRKRLKVITQKDDDSDPGKAIDISRPPPSVSQANA